MAGHELAEALSAAQEALRQSLDRLEGCRQQWVGVCADLDRQREELRSQRDELAAERAKLDREKASFPTPDPHQPVHLNVGGRHVTTTRHTLSLYPESMLAVMFSGRHPLQTDSDGRIIIDRNPEYFCHILDFLRNRGSLPTPPRDPTTWARIRHEFDYFLVPWPYGDPSVVERLRKKHDVVVLAGHSGAVTAVDINGPLAASGGGEGDCSVRLWDIPTGTCKKILLGHKEPINCVCLSADGRLASGSDDRTLRVWDLASGKLVMSAGQYGRVTAVGMCGNLAVVGVLQTYQVNKIKVWNMKEKCILWEAADVNMFTGRISIFNDRFFGGGVGNEVVVWDVKTGAVVERMSGHTGKPNRVGLGPEKAVSVTSDINGFSISSEVCRWDRKTGRLESTTEFQSRLPFDVIGGYAQLLADNNVLEVCDLNSGEVMRLEGHEGTILCGGVWGEVVVTGSSDKTLMVWRPEATPAYLLPD